MTPEQLEGLRRLSKKYRIIFNDRRSSNEWPIAHAGLFADVTKLGATQYSIYAKSVDSRSPDEPWAAQAIDRAHRVVEIAGKCKRERRNEAGWRLALEPEIFSRFTVEVACHKCRARIWRSEIEARIESNNLEGPSLEQRRKLRTPCRCPLRSSHIDTGSDPLFSDRAEELVEHEEPVRLALARQEHPDRIYGLRETKTFENVLCSPSSAHTRAEGEPMLVCEAIRITPFKQVGDPLLFPFLILEAKSAKGEDFYSIQLQTAFPIRTLLKMQSDLQNECGKLISWQGGPLVWFLSNRGEDWRVAACFVDNTNGEASYCIFHLWNGVITSKEGALQLLLIVDHMFDWARDIYRPVILRHLKSLSDHDASDTMSIANDSDIFSLNNPVGRWIFRIQSVAPSNAMEASKFEDRLDIVQPLRGLEWIGGVAFRHVRFVDSEFLGIHITGDNANTLLLQAKTPKQAVAFARKLLRAILNGRSILLTEETLIELEDIWTGGASHFANTVTPATEFVVRLLLKRSLSDDWKQVRELSYLAASQEGLDVLMNRSKLRRPSRETASACDQQSVKAIVRSHLSAPAARNLRAAIAREALSLETTEESAPGGRRSERLVLAKEEKDQAHGLIHEIYRKHKVGMREPAEPFIRRTTRTDEQTFEQAPPPNTTLRYLNKGDPLDPHNNGLFQHILVFGRCAKTSGLPEMCYYKLSGPPKKPKALDVRTALQQMLHTDSKIYTTERYARASFQTNWNSDNFHEIYQPVADYQRGEIESCIADLDRIDDDCFNISSLSPANNSMMSSASATGAPISERRVSSRKRRREAQHTSTRNESQHTPTHHGNGIASSKRRRRPMLVELIKDDGYDVPARIEQLCKKLCHDFETYMKHEQDKHHSAIIADATIDAEEVVEVRGLIQNQITNFSPPDYDFQRAMETHLEDRDSAPATPVLREFTDMNGRWTYSHGEHVRFIRAT